MEDGLPAPNRTVADTSIFTQGLRFVESTRSLERVAARQAKGDEAETTKTGSSPAAPAATSAVALPPAEQTAAQDKENEVATYAPDQSAPIRYEVERTGYYCVRRAPFISSAPGRVLTVRPLPAPFKLPGRRDSRDALAFFVGGGPG